jgi:ABC-type branched-subunit amino acid transport system substrate-binding protein
LAEGRGRWLAALALLTAALHGCDASDGSADATEGPVTVYVSLPLSGTNGAHGRDAVEGARLALDDADHQAGDLRVRVRFLDDSRNGRPSIVAAAENARTATSDSSSAAYIGELDSATTRTSLPITNEAGLLQVSPGATAPDLTGAAPGPEDDPEIYQPSGEPNFARVVPVGGPLIGPRDLPASGREFVSRFRDGFEREPGAYAAYGYVAMQVVLAAIADAGGGESFRDDVRQNGVDMPERDSVLGRFAIVDGDTTLCAGRSC